MKKVRYAVIGVNKEGIGRSHARSITLSPNSELVLLCDNDEEAKKYPEAKAGGVAAVAEEFGVAYTHDYRDILTNDEIDAVVVATPDFMHREMVVALLNAGKHVLCEKPMALIREDCVEMVRAAKANDRLLMVGQVVRKDQLFLAAKKYIDAGEIGEIFAVESQYAHDYGDMQSDWRKNPKYPRHIVVGGGCHAIDMLRWIVGNPVEVFAYANHKVLDNYPVDDTTVAVIKFENGAIGRVFCSMAAKTNMGMRTVFYGSKGTLVASGSELIFYKDEIAPGDKNYLGHKAQHVTVHIPVIRDTHNTLAEIQEFSDAVLGITPLTVDGIEGASTVAVCDAIVRSAATGDKVTVDYDFFE